jgi:drug/metabolite transporter (DMT)-like permease
MKLNFWQWLGIILVVVAGIYIIQREMSESRPTKPSSPGEPAQNATQPM